MKTDLLKLIVVIAFAGAVFTALGLTGLSVWPVLLVGGAATGLFTTFIWKVN